MRRKILTAAAVGVLGFSGLAVASPALAATGTPGASAVNDRVSALKQALSGLVKDGTLTQTQADKVATTLGSENVPGFGRGGFGHGPGRGADLSAAATALGMSEADLRTALQNGKTLAAVAKDKGVSVDTLVAALVKAAQARIAQDVKDGRLTQAQADQILSGLQARITERVNSARPAGGPGHRHGGFDADGDGDGSGGSGTQSPTPSTATPSPSATS